MVRVVTISGSLRALSANGIVLDAVHALASPRLQLVRYHGLADLPHFSPDRDNDDPPASVVDLRRAVAAAGGLIIASPEYAHGVPGSLKNALDWLVSGIEIVAKPVVLLNTAPRATWAQTSLRETLTTMSARVLTDPAAAIPLAGRRLDLAGLLADPELVAPIRAALALLESALDLASPS